MYGIAGLFALGSLWHGFTIWLLQRYITKQSSHWFCTWPMQFSLLAALTVFALMAMTNDPFAVLAVIAVVVMPPLVLLVLSIPFVSFVMFPLTLTATGLAMLVPKARPSAPTLGVLSALLVTPFVADLYWGRAMCAAAREQGLTGVQSPGFWHNLRRISSKSGREPYAYALRGGEIWDWGYSAERFVRYGGDIPGWVDLSGFEPLDCEGNN